MDHKQTARKYGGKASKAPRKRLPVMRARYFDPEQCARTWTPTTKNENSVAATIDDCTQSQDVDESSDHTSKRVRSVSNEEDIDVQGTMKFGLNRLATVIEKYLEKEQLPKDLWQNLKSLSGFNSDHLAHYYAYLVENPPIAKAFNTLDIPDKDVWVNRYIKKNFDA